MARKARSSDTGSVSVDDSKPKRKHHHHKHARPSKHGQHDSVDDDERSSARSFVGFEASSNRSRHSTHRMRKHAVSATASLSEIMEVPDEDSDSNSSSIPTDDYDVHDAMLKAIGAISKSAQGNKKRSAAGPAKITAATDPAMFEELVQREVDKRLETMLGKQKDGTISDIDTEDEDGAATPRSRRSGRSVRWDATSAGRARSTSPLREEVKRLTRRIQKSKRPLKGITAARCVRCSFALYDCCVGWWCCMCWNTVPQCT